MGLLGSQAASTAIGGIGDVANLIYGIGQMRKGTRMKESWERKRPVMETPESVNEMVSLFRDLSKMDRLPGQDIYEGNIASSQATGIEAVKDMSRGGESLGAVTQMVAGTQDKYSQLQANLENMVFQNQGRFGSALGVKGQYERENWNWNKKGQWQEKMSEANAMMGAGTQNVFGSVSSMGQNIGDAIGLAGIMKSGGEDGKIPFDQLLKILGIGQDNSDD